MVFFQCDYAEGCHPRILEKLIESNLLQSVGYGLDEHCENARSLIKKACGREDIDVHFLVGGTQTNITVISPPASSRGSGPRPAISPVTKPAPSN